jgi:hypothetical protein
VLGLLATVSLATAVGPARADAEPESGVARFKRAASQAGFVSVDLVFLRPLGAVRLLVGTLGALPLSSAINLIAYPISRDPLLFREDVDRYVIEPAEYLARPLGRDLAG